MNSVKKIIGLLILNGLPLLLMAQQQEAPVGLRSSGKIYVVVGVILIILAGLIAYLISLDRKIKRLERRIKQDGNQ
jgi:hypothetical protein